MSRSVRDAIARGGRFLPVWFAVAALLAFSKAIGSSSVSSHSLNNLVFFAALIGLAALGQHLVVVVGGLDLSVAPQITLSALLFATLAGGSRSTASATTVIGCALVALLACLVVGAMNGVFVTALRLSPIIATLAGGALATGAAYTLNSSGAANAVPGSVGDVATERYLAGVLAVPTLAWVAAVLMVAAFLRWTVVGRRFVAVGDSGPAARALGIHPARYRIAGYAAGGMFYGLAGLALAGVAQQPGLSLGEPYLLPAIAAVVVGGTPLGGGIGSVVATAGGALFMTHLDSLVLSLKASTGAQLMVQGIVIAAAMAAYRLRVPAWVRRGVAGLKRGPVQVGSSG